MGLTKADMKREKKHVRVYRDQMATEAWLALSGSAVKVMLAMGLLENGDNNGEFYFSDRKGAEMTGLSRNTVRKAINELIDTGFVYCSVRGGFSRKTPHAACYGFTWMAGPKGSEHRAPSHAYQKWKHGGNTRAQFLTATGPVSAIDMETSPLAGSVIAPDEMEKRLVSAKVHLSDIEPQTVSQGIGAAGLETEQRKQAIPISAAFPANLRDMLLAHLSTAEPGEQSRLAKSLGIHGGTLSKFVNGRNLPEHHAATLARALAGSART